MTPSLVYEFMANFICKVMIKRLIGNEHGTWPKYLNDAFQAFIKTTPWQLCEKVSEKLYGSRVHINNVHQGLHFLQCRNRDLRSKEAIDCFEAMADLVFDV